MTFLCKFGWHRWSKWSRPFEITLVRSEYHGMTPENALSIDPVERVVRQTTKLRCCLKCGRDELLDAHLSQVILDDPTRDDLASAEGEIGAGSHSSRLRISGKATGS